MFAPLYRNCSRRLLDRLTNANSSTLRTVVRLVLQLLSSAAAATRTRRSNSTTTGSSMEVSVTSLTHSLSYPCQPISNFFRLLSRRIVLRFRSKAPMRVLLFGLPKCICANCTEQTDSLMPAPLVGFRRPGLRCGCVFQVSILRAYLARKFARDSRLWVTMTRGFPLRG